MTAGRVSPKAQSVADTSASRTAFAATVAASAATQRAAPAVHGRERYRVVREIGRGGMGVVTEVDDVQFGRRVALKESLDAAGEARFVQEALVTANLEHPGIPPVYDRGEDATGRAYYAMRLVRGRSLADAIAGARDMKARLALVPIALRVAQTLAHAHERGVVHRDVKPDNVVLGDHGEAVLVDWGVAKVRGLPHDDALAGTPRYMAPEQARGGADEVDERTDVFAVGVLLYEILVGRPAYSGSGAELLDRVQRGDFTPIRDAIPNAPEPLCAVVDRAMSLDREERYASATALASDLEGALAESLVAAQRSHVTRFAAATMTLTSLALASGGVLVWRALPPLHALGPSAVAYPLWLVLGGALSIIEIVTRGKHRLAPLVVAFIALTAISGVASASTGLIVMLGGLASEPIASDAHKWRMLMAFGSLEALAHLPLCASTMGVQIFLWALARRRALSSTPS